MPLVQIGQHAMEQLPLLVHKVRSVAPNAVGLNLFAGVVDDIKLASLNAVNQDLDVALLLVANLLLLYHFLHQNQLSNL